MNLLNKPLRITAMFGVLGTLFFVLPPASQAATIELISLRCITPQERDANGDELRLSIGRASMRRNGIRAGSVWRLGTKFNFFGSVSVRLTEVDSFPSLSPRDEQLGSRLIREPKRATVGSIRFNRHGSNYLLTYRVVPKRRLKLIVHSLRCIATQERDANGDELRLSAKSEIANFTMFRRNGIRAGSRTTVGRSILFDKRVTLTLTEIDSFPSLTPRDEMLGRFTIASKLGVGSLRFNRHGSHYILTYQVVRE